MPMATSGSPVPSSDAAGSSPWVTASESSSDEEYRRPIVWELEEELRKADSYMQNRHVGRAQRVGNTEPPLGSSSHAGYADMRAATETQGVVPGLMPNPTPGDLQTRRSDTWDDKSPAAQDKIKEQNERIKSRPSWARKTGKSEPGETSRHLRNDRAYIGTRIEL